jgi:hypothetical protein
VRLRRYEISAARREEFIMAALDCAREAARLARKEKDGEQARHFADAAARLLDSGECNITPVEVECY